MVMSERPFRIIEEIPVALPDPDNPCGIGPAGREYVATLAILHLHERRPDRIHLPRRASAVLTPNLPHPICRTLSSGPLAPPRWRRSERQRGNS